ncbi:MAG: TrmB family transcriptional regulator [Candidatus Bathyarchaeota archaeon]|nr:MAG: TrmB family transcriptional regulator [Candidatus Bathyarchaeota archaeon]
MNVVISEEAIKVLREIGLTSYETRAYLALLEKGVMTASEAGRQGGVPYSKVYETLNSLVKKGWVTVEDGRPRRYYPKSPYEALEAARLRLEDIVVEWKHVVMDELQPMYKRRELREKPVIWILRGEFSVLAKLREMLRETKNELMVAAPMWSNDFLEASVPLLSHLRDSGISVQVMVTNDCSMKEVTGIGEIRVRDNMFGGGVIVDGREALLLLGENETSLVIWSSHMGLVKFARDYFQYLWETAGNIG